MSADPVHSNAPKPLIYAAPCLVFSGLMILGGVVFLMLAIDDHDNIPARLFSSVLLVLGVLGAGFTALCWRVDVARREARKSRAASLAHAERLAGEITDTIINTTNKFTRVMTQMDELISIANATLVQTQAAGRIVSETLEVAKSNREALRQSPVAHQPRPRRRRRAKGGTDYAKGFVDGSISQEEERKLRLIKPDDEPGDGRRLRGDSGDR